MSHPFAAGATTGAVNALLRLEGGVALFASIMVYTYCGGGWGRFALLFLLPDVSMLGYLINSRWGAACYNAGHSYLAPALLGAIGWALGLVPLFGLAAIWSAHIGFDRMVGYGLKYSTGFGATHLRA